MYASLSLSPVSTLQAIQSILQVQSLRFALALRLHDSLPRGPEVCHLHPHASLPQRHQSGFGADGLDVGSGEVVFLVDEFVEIDVIVEGHFGGVEGEDLAFGVFYRL